MWNYSIKEWWKLEWRRWRRERNPGWKIRLCYFCQALRACDDSKDELGEDLLAGSTCYRSEIVGLSENSTFLLFKLQKQLILIKKRHRGTSKYHCNNSKRKARETLPLSATRSLQIQVRLSFQFIRLWIHQSQRPCEESGWHHWNEIIKQKSSFHLLKGIVRQLI